MKLVCVEREHSFCYVAVSRGGRVGVYSGDMRLLYSYEVMYGRFILSKCATEKRLPACVMTLAGEGYTKDARLLGRPLPCSGENYV